MVAGFADILSTPERFQRDGCHQVCKEQLEGVLGLVISRLRMSQLIALTYGANIAIWRGSVQAFPIVALLIQEVQTFMVNVPQPIPQVGVSRSLHYQHWREASAGEIQ